MNVFNRAALSLVLLVLLAAAVAAIVFAWALPQHSINGLRDAVNWLNDNNETLQKVVLTAACAAIAFLALIVLLLELTPSRADQVRVKDVTAGDATLSSAAIGQRVEESLRTVPHVAEARAIVRPKRKGVVVALDLHVDPEANLAAVSDEASQAAVDVLSEKVHVTMVQPPRIRLHYRELRLQRAPAREAAQTGSVPEPVAAPIPATPAKTEASDDLAASVVPPPADDEHPEPTERAE